MTLFTPDIVPFRGQNDWYSFGRMNTLFQPKHSAGKPQMFAFGWTTKLTKKLPGVTKQREGVNG
jgi:hypothetical protein